jgi:hypothetical protein
VWKDRLPEISAHRRFALLIWWCTVALIALLQLSIHARGIGDPELWLDESSTWGVARRSLRQVLTLPTEFHSQPPLYYLVLHFVMKLSDARWFMRGFSWACCLGLLSYVLLFVDELSLAARVGFCALFVSSELPGYLSSALRPYGLAALTSFVSTVLFLRMLRSPSPRRAIHYAAAALIMAYTTAFDVWVLAVHGASLLAVLVAAVVRKGARATWSERRAAVGAMAVTALGYAPYLWMAVHFQYRHNADADLRYALQLGHVTYIAREFFAFRPAAMAALYGLIALGLVSGLRERDAGVLTWLVIAVGQVIFVVYFMNGRNSIGPAGRYITPAFPAALMLAARGLSLLTARGARWVWPLVPVALLWVAWPASRAFVAHLREPVPLGTWGKLRLVMLRRPGGIGVFFDVGYAAQDFEYVVRDDPGLRVFTMRGPGLTAGGNDHLDPDYMLRSIAETRATTSCYYYRVANPAGVFSTTFVPEMARLGYEEQRPLYGTRVYCRPD